MFEIKDKKSEQLGPKLLKGDQHVLSEFNDQLSKLKNALMYISTTSVEVERSFSVLNMFATKGRSRLVMEYLKFYVF